MRAYHVRDIHPPVQKLIHFNVLIRIRLARLFPIVFFRKKTRGPQDQAGKPSLAMEQLAQILCRLLGYSINISGNWCYFFGYPCRWRSRRRSQCAAKSASRAGEDEAFRSREDGLFQKIECARDVGINKALPAVGDDVRFVQRGRVKHSIHPSHAPLHKLTVGDGPDLIGEFRGKNVSSGHFDGLLP